ncbi:MAG: 50S ribosome-binding GTPase [Bryobacteraceae bacterium]|nr:50S ribosome-binding GTPase [Bryobacteraceae bacterium]
MPANLTPEYLDAEQEYKAARTHQERIAALERMLATVPKHKGTEKLQADIKRRLSQERKEAHKKGGSRSAPVFLVEKEGAGQLALIGPPNSGKSSLVAALTHAEPEIAEFPFSTRLPCPGMMQFENVQIQLVDLPPLSRDFMEPWLPQAIRHVGEGILVVDISDPDLLEEIEFIEGLLEERRLKRPRMLVANKSDLDPTGEDFRVLQDLLGERYRMLAVSAATGANLDRFRREVFDLLELVRVYTKRPGKPADLTAPYVLRRGATVLDVARHVHKDFAERLKYARLYTKDGRRDGLMVERTHLVEDEDILEFHV